VSNCHANQGANVIPENFNCKKILKKISTKFFLDEKGIIVVAEY
jgi:hypothetical protein